MKKFAFWFLSIILAVSLWVTTFAAVSGTVLVMQINSKTMYLIENGAEKTLQRDTAPVSVNGSTLVPVRTVSELLGATVNWNNDTKTVTVIMGSSAVEMQINNPTAYVNGNYINMSVPPQIIGGSTMIPVRFVSENMGLNVFYDDSTKAVAISFQPLDAGDFKSLNCVKNLKPVPVQQPASAPSSEGKTTYYKKDVNVSGKKISADIIEVNMNNTNVSVRTYVVGNKLNNTTSFANIVNDRKPIAAINGNFFNAYDSIKDPVGTIMSQGQIIYGSSGLTSMGITADNKIMFGKPAVFTKIYTTDNGNPEEYTAFEVNVLSQAGEQAVLYTPARGTSVNITNTGSVMKVENDTVTSYTGVNPGDSVSIPANGYIVYFSQVVTSTNYFKVPTIGRKVAIRYTLFKPDDENFNMETVKEMVSGAPRLVKNGAIDNTPLEAGFAGDARFTTSSSPRTAIGKTADNKLLLVSATCTIAQLKELMLAIGTVDALNIDGGASNAMYYNGKFIRQPGRQLTSVILVE